MEIKKILKALKKGFQETDIFFLLICLCLSAFGTVSVASATARTVTDGGISRDATVMILAVVLGTIACLIISFIDYDLILKLWPLIAACSLFLMLLLLTPLGVAPDGRQDARSWIKLTSSLYLQPSEILKIGFIITFSQHLSKVRQDLTGLKNVFLLCVHALIPIGLVVITGDMGSALIFILMFVGMMFVSGVHKLYFPAGILAVAAASPVVWFKVFDDIQRNRILALFNPEKYSTEIYQQQQALNAMKEGGFSGTGLFKGPFTQSGSIPECQNDMIFAVVCEELGFIGAVALILLFILLAYRIVAVSNRAKNFSAKMICYGVMFMIISQVVINIGMCTMLLPVIGITLPFMSAGGSSVVCLYLAVGLILSIYRSSSGIVYSDYRYARIASNYS